MKPASILASLFFFSVVSGAPGPLRAVPITPDLVPDLTMTRAGQSMVLGWFGENGMTYQIEVSSALRAWASTGPVINGSGAPLAVPILIAGQSRIFFRVLRLPGGTLSASFSPATAVLTITGDSAPNAMVVSRDAAGVIRINNGAVTVQGGSPTVANTTVIQVFGREGNDHICLDESNGALPRAQLSGEAGDDTLTGGSGKDMLNGGPGFDTLLGMGGADILIGGDEDDTVTGGDGDDTAQLGSGNDRFIWNPGDDTDLVDGGDGVDTVEANGGNAAEYFTATANTPRVRFDRLNPAPFSLDLGTCEHLVLNANGGDDTFAATGNLATLIQITVDGGAGADWIAGSNGNDQLIGGDNNDFIDGNQGTDVIVMGAGDDIFQWDPGDGLDTVEGETGTDQLRFNGSGDAENFDISAHGTRLHFSRNLGNVTLDLAGVEFVELNALRGTDIITVNDLATTEVSTLNLHLAGVIGGGGNGDGQVDAVIFHGTQGTDMIEIAQNSIHAAVVGLKPLVAILSGDATDTITINGHGGNDSIDAFSLTAHFAVTIDGGPGHDTIIGSLRGDILAGGDDHDTITGSQGDDTIFGGPGDDTFIWTPGDANDVMEGQAGKDKLLFNGSNANENIDLSANGPRLRCDVANNVTLDCDDVEKVEFNALAGTDNITAGDLTSTDVNEVIVDLSGSNGGGDGRPDSIVVNGTPGVDTIVVSNSPAGVTVTGLSASWTITGAQAANDRLTLEGQAGADTLLFNGANVAELIDLAAIGPRLRFFRNIANVVMDCGGVEQVVFNALGGADTITVNDLTGTGVTNVNLALGATLDSNVGDAQPDNITVTGTAANDTVLVIGSASGVSTVGLSATVTITGSEAANDRITINVLAGDDTVDASGLSAGAIGLTVDGGIDGDLLVGSHGPDILLGGDGDDVLIGGPGLDTLNGGTGDNTIIPD